MNDDVKNDVQDDIKAQEAAKLSSKAADVNATNFWVAPALNDNSMDLADLRVAGFVDDFGGVLGGERESKTATPINTKQYETIITQGAIKKDDFTLKAYYDFAGVEGVNLIQECFDQAKALWVRVGVPDNSNTTIDQRGKVSAFKITTEKDGKYMADITIMKEGDFIMRTQYAKPANAVDFWLGAHEEEPIVGVTYAKYIGKQVFFNSFKDDMAPTDGAVRKAYKFDATGKCIQKDFERFSEFKGKFEPYTPKAYVPVDTKDINNVVEFEGEKAAQPTLKEFTFHATDTKGTYGVGMNCFSLQDADGALKVENAKSTAKNGASFSADVMKDGAKIATLNATCDTPYSVAYGLEHILDVTDTKDPSGFSYFLASGASQATGSEFKFTFDQEINLSSFIFRDMPCDKRGVNDIEVKVDGKVTSSKKGLADANKHTSPGELVTMDLLKPAVPVAKPVVGTTKLDWANKTVYFFMKERSIKKPLDGDVRFKYNCDAQGVVGAELREVFSDMDNAFHYEKKPVIAPDDTAGDTATQEGAADNTAGA